MPAVHYVGLHACSPGTTQRLVWSRYYLWTLFLSCRL